MRVELDLLTAVEEDEDEFFGDDLDADDDGELDDDDLYNDEFDGE